MRWPRTMDWDWAPANPTNFTGRVEVARLSVPSEESPIDVTAVRFAANARTHWHSHPQGQALWVVSGVVRVGNGEEVFEVGPGEHVEIEPGELHWQGATSAGPMVHLSITDGTHEWTGRPVPDEAYDATARSQLDKPSDRRGG